MNKKKPEPMPCERCGLNVYQMEVRDNMFYCDECAKIWDRAEAVKDVDNDKKINTNNG